jgi:adenosyl cobinamide kinase/adenosyl cobinamide phosphate guanylyltransferase
VAREGLTVVVSNEVGLGLVPMHPVGRAYRDALGRVNAVWSAAAHEAYLVVAGRALPLTELADA